MTLEEIKENLSILEGYLCEGTEEEQQFATKLIKKGVCFVAYKIEDEFRFSPSRYVGYSKNTMQRHSDYKYLDGKETNPAINKILGHKAIQNSEIEKEYLSFTSKLGIKPDNRKWKFWQLNISISDYKNSPSINEGFPEGNIVERKHMAIERNSKLIAVAKETFLQEEGKLFCMICGFDFENKYGEKGQGFIEAHHTIPVSEMSPGQQTKIADIALVCSNCHRVLHRSRPWLSINELKDIIK
ncbi:MAG: HNH endonuclease [Candidatus Electrothrix sp. AR3]|nr:HNH endonuclease [Candidatus Electrothrix sp. AR3]